MQEGAMRALRSGLIFGAILGMVIVMYAQGIEPTIDRLYYGPDQADCVRIEGCRDGDVIVWSHSDIQTVFVCEGEIWTAFNATDEWTDSGEVWNDDSIESEKF
jgi:hypothetical protein